MNFTITCECGRSHSVHEAHSGLSVDCQCGQTVAIPSLAELRKSVGLPSVPVSPAEHVTSLVDEGTLPPGECVDCGSLGADELRLVAICETETTHSSSPSIGWAELMTVVSLLTPYVVVIFNFKDDNEFAAATVFGRDTTVPVPVRLCDSCRQHVPSKWSWFPRRLLQVVFVAGLILLGMRGLQWYGAGMVLLASLSAIAFAWQRRQRSNAMKRMVSTIPEYRELVEYFPGCQISDDRW